MSKAKKAHPTGTAGKHHDPHADLDEEFARLDREKKGLQTERAQMLAERSNLDEKDKKLCSLFSLLDDRESKMRQYLDHLTEQKEQWLRSSTDLLRRETVLEDWAVNHKAREDHIKSLEEAQEKRFNDIVERENAMAASEQDFKIKMSDFDEKEAKLQHFATNLANTEANFSNRDDQLTNLEGELRKREGDIEIREREIASRRREMESWDVLLRDKDKKMASEMKRVDEKEDSLIALEEKNKLSHQEADQRLKLVKEKEDYMLLQEKQLASSTAIFEEKDRKMAEQMKQNRAKESELRTKEENLCALEEQLKMRKEQLKMLEQREEDLQHRIEKHLLIEKDFFGSRVSQITNRYSMDMDYLEKQIAKLIQLSMSLKCDLDKTKMELCKVNGSGAMVQNAVLKFDKIAFGASPETNETVENPKVPIEDLVKSFEQILIDMKPSISSLKTLDDDRIKAIEYSEKLRVKYAGTIYDTNSREADEDVYTKKKSATVLHAPLGYGANANPNNSIPYLNQLTDSNKDFVSVVSGIIPNKEQKNEDSSRNTPTVATPNRRRTLM